MKSITIEINEELEAALGYHAAKNQPKGQTGPQTGLQYLEARIQDVTQGYVESFQAEANEEYFKKLQSLPKQERDEVAALIRSKYEALPKLEVETK